MTDYMGDDEVWGSDLEELEDELEDEMEDDEEDFE